MQKSNLRLLIQLHLLSHLLFSRGLHVASSLVDNVAGLLARLLNLLEGSRLFLFEQADAVRHQAQIVFGALPCDLGRDELLMQSSIIVLLVWREVHLGVLLSTWVLHRGRAVKLLHFEVRVLCLHLFK